MFKKYHIPYELDDPRHTIAHRDIILNKPFLKKLYTNWYNEFKERTGTNGKHLEIGSGGGFYKEVNPGVITSDILPLPGVDMVINAEKLPFENNELKSIVMLNVFHHIPRPYLFLQESERVLEKGGKVVMIEPANSALGRFIYKRFHHEPFDENGPMEIKPGNPLSNSNQALPYIYFEKDPDQFKKMYPHLKIKEITYHSPFSYIISGGVSRSAMLPSALFKMVKFVEAALSPLSRQLGLFCTVEIEKI